MSIDERHFANVDLNLMITFLVLYREGNVTRSAACLKVGQPAVSGALARLRLQFDDPLFLRTRIGMRPTPKAIQLAQVLLPALGCIESALKKTRNTP